MPYDGNIREQKDPFCVRPLVTPRRGAGFSCYRNTHNVVMDVSFDSSGGIVPVNWLASSCLRNVIGNVVSNAIYQGSCSFR